MDIKAPFSFKEVEIIQKNGIIIITAIIDIIE
jgi:hypothetical protein